MYLRGVLVLAALAGASSAMAGELKREEAKRFVAGKVFSYACFEGTTGAGRINADGSVAGSIQFRAGGQTHYVALPAGTIQVRPTSICAYVRGLLFQPCFDVVQTDSKSFRGSLSGLGFAYCDFTRRNPRLNLAGQVSQPLPIHSAVMTTSGGE